MNERSQSLRNALRDHANRWVALRDGDWTAIVSADSLPELYEKAGALGHENPIVWFAASETSACVEGDGEGLLALSRPEAQAESARLRAALTEMRNNIAQAPKGYCGDHHVYTVQHGQAELDRLTALLADGGGA